jgi:hypothetical protein
MFLLPGCLPLAKGHDMAKPQSRPDACRQLTSADRRRSPKARILPILFGLFVITFVTAALAAADLQGTPAEKGTNPMQQAATPFVRDVPPLDKSQPSRVETFTFGLG